ncbi:hypothetical protein LJR125_000444 [Pseudoxanthomonas sp. LjRoot125]|uniref:hypothetical protein n=1 Tax=Pseudoxanthomonas sp. LjRoot125 TaxID=3342258 RepID=UPI003E124403
MYYRHALSFIVIVGLGLPSAAGAEKLTGRSTLWTYAPCEGVGLHGAASARYEADITRERGKITLTSLQVIIDSAQFERAAVTVAAGLESSDSGSRTALVRPWFDTIRKAADRSQDFYLPPRPSGGLMTDQAPITLTFGKNPTVTVSAYFQVDGGTCVMGTGILTIDVPWANTSGASAFIRVFASGTETLTLGYERAAPADGNMSITNPRRSASGLGFNRSTQQFVDIALPVFRSQASCGAVC